jgi:serine phosphatase RsbU (regulator of sigma subunit)
MLATTLKTRFSLSIALVCLFLGGITLLAIHFSTQRIINSLGTRFAVKQALLEKTKLMSQVQQDLTLSLKMAHSPILQDWMEHEGNVGQRHEAIEELESYRESFKGKILFLAIDHSGHYYFANGSKNDFRKPRYTLDKNNPNDAWYFRDMHGVDTFELNIDYDNHLKVNKIWFNVVVRDRQQQKIGLCGTGIDITRFINEIINSNEPGIQTILFSAGGIIEGHKNQSYVIHNSKVRGNEKKTTIYDLMENQGDRDRVKAAVARLTHNTSKVEKISISMYGKRYIAAISYMKEIRWYNLVLLNAQQVIGSRTFLPFITISVLAMLLIVVIVVVLLNRLVLQPLSRLSVSANKMAAGDFDISIPVTAMDEIGSLTMSFNEMAAMVKDHSENLEQKVIQRTEELNVSTQMLSESNKKIMASIRYARLIQASILPSEEVLQRHLRDFFALYRPRDIVGGDFYFFRELREGFIIAVIDCTGHGVPGAFMTMTTNAVLSDIIDSLGIDNPADILRSLNRRFQDALHQNIGEERIDYGLDMGLCRFIPKTGEIIFSGAGIDLYMVINGKVQVIRADRTSLGYRRSGTELQFESTRLQVVPDMQFYLISDGILDQSGGNKGWGFGRKRFTNLVATLAGLPASEQLDIMESELSSYQGDRPQRDDITAVGFRIIQSEKIIEGSKHETQ